MPSDRRLEPEALRPLFERWYRPLCRFAASIVADSTQAEDIVQGAFVKVWHDRHRLSVDRLEGYLYDIVRTRAYNWVRDQARRRRALVTTAVVTEAHTADSSPLEQLERAELELAVAKAIEALPPRTRQAFELHRAGGLDYRGVAALMGTSPHTVKVQIGRALRQLRRHLAPFLASLV